MSDTTDRDGASDTLVQRVPGSRLKLWLLLEANRTVLAGSILVGVFAALVLLGVLDPVPLRSAVESSDPIETLFQGLVTAIITGVTLVVTINQLVLSQELGPLGDQRERMQGAMEFRRDVEDTLDTSASPADPAGYLRTLLEHTHDRADRLIDAVGEPGSGDLEDRVVDYARDVVENTDAVADELEGAQFGTFGVLSAALDFNYSWKIYEGRRFRRDHGDALGDEVTDALDDLIEILLFFGPAREHVKTLYFQWALIDLSRAIVYSAVPAFVVSSAIILFLDDRGSVTGTFLGVDALLLVVSAGVVVALTPFALLLSYILRIATIAKRTLAIGPFVLRETDLPTHVEEDGGSRERGDE